MTIVKGDWRREKRYTQGHKSNGKHTLTKRKQPYSSAGLGSTVQPVLGKFSKQRDFFSARVSQTSLTKMPTYHDNDSEVKLSVNLSPHLPIGPASKRGKVVLPSVPLRSKAPATWSDTVLTSPFSQFRAKWCVLASKWPLKQEVPWSVFPPNLLW